MWLLSKRNLLSSVGIKVTGNFNATPAGLTQIFIRAIVAFKPFRAKEGMVVHKTHCYHAWKLASLLLFIALSLPRNP
jgi:hypothetical protein